MLKRSVIVCCSIFLLLLMLGWRLEDNIHQKQLKTLVLSSNTNGYNALSTKFTTSIHINTPFLPREYVRIIRRVSE